MSQQFSPGSSDALLVVNPLPIALRHYESALLGHLGRPVEVVRVPAEVGGASAGRKLWTALCIAVLYLRLLRRRGPVLVLWPTFGLAEIALWRWSRGDRYLVIHDPVPLRRQSGYSRTSHFLAARASRSPRVRVVTHTHLARQSLSSRGLNVALVLPHPFSPRPRPSARRRRSVLVAGQSKDARDLGILTAIAQLAPSDVALEVVGRGWEAVPGWNVDARFVPEAELDERLATAGAVLIPYRFYFQSGIASRACELGTPVVAERHEFIESLYGSDWPGLVDGDGAGAWLRAIDRALESEAPPPRSVQGAADRAWREAFPA